MLLRSEATNDLHQPLGPLGIKLRIGLQELPGYRRFCDDAGRKRTLFAIGICARLSHAQSLGPVKHSAPCKLADGGAGPFGPDKLRYGFSLGYRNKGWVQAISPLDAVTRART